MSGQHRVTWDGQDIVFVCDAPPTAKCRIYPRCDCESWDPATHLDHYGPGHENVQHAECWMQGWFDLPLFDDDGIPRTLWEAQ